MSAVAQKLYRRAPHVVSRKVGPESVLVPVGKNVADLESVYTLSEVAARVWTLLDGELALPSLVERICAEYDVDVPTAEADLGELLASLEEAGLVSAV